MSAEPQMAKKEKKKTDVQLKARVPKAMMDAVNEYRFKHHLETRTDAVVDLLARGLATDRRQTDGGTDGQDPTS